MRSVTAVVMALVALTGLLVSCGGSEPDERSAMTLRANAVTGESLYYADLFDEPTVLWFWAPW